MNAIEFKHVSFSYEGYEDKVLSDASFSVSYGEVALLSGFSGEGKSTVLSLIAGIIPNIIPGEIWGKIFIDGEDISKHKMGDICRKVGVVLQNAEEQIVHQLVEDEIAFGCENFAFSQEKIQSRITRSCGYMKLHPAWKTRTLSGGQKQRVAIASAIASKRSILFFDEPTSGLDYKHMKEVANVLRQVRDTGITVYVITHDLELILDCCTDIVHFEDGSIIDQFPMDADGLEKIRNYFIKGVSVK